MLQVSSDNLNFIAENSIVIGRHEQKGGLGLNNLRKRLDLIYPENYKLDITETNDKFSVKLDLSLKAYSEKTQDENKMPDNR